MEEHYKNLWEQLKGEYEEKETVDSFFPFIFSIAKRLTKDEQDAKDLTQNVSETFYKKKPLKKIKDTYGLIYSSVRNHFLNIVISNQRRQKHEGHYALSIPRSYEIEEATFERKNLNFHQKMIFIHFKSQLTKKEFNFLNMLYNGMSVEDIAEELGVSVKRVRNRKTDIYKKLRNLNSLIFIFLYLTYGIQNLLNLVR